MHQIEPAGIDRVPALSEMLGRAFGDDPMFVWPLGPDPTGSRAEGFFRAFDERLAQRGWLWTTARGDGVAAWVPPGEDETMMDIDRSLHPAIGALAPDGGVRYEVMWEWIASNLPDEPFWYLDHLAVDTGARRTGLGTALIEHGLAMADRDDAPAFLETARPGNVGYYERRGFRVVGDGDVPGGGPHIWFMSRAPAPPPPAAP